MTLTKAELTQTVVGGVGLNQREAKEMVDAFFSEISACLVGREGVKLSGFGSFETRDKVERPGRNPMTGEKVMVTARCVVTFHPSNTLKQVVERSRYAEKSPDGCPRITLHVGSFVVKAPILQYFVRTNQHDDRFSRAFFPAV